MLKRMVEFSLRFRGVVITLACLFLGYGLYQMGHAKYDAFPEFAPPQVVIQTEGPGLSPEEVEVLVTRPIEQAINGVGNLESLQSQSIQGLSIVTAIFQEGTDIFKARQMVTERLVEASNQMPQGVPPPVLAPLTSSASIILSVGLTSESRSPMEIRTFADWILRPRLLGIPGVAKVVVYGGEVRQLQIQVKPEQLALHGLAVSDLLKIASQGTGVRGAGFVEGANQRIVLQTEGESQSPEALGEVALGPYGEKSLHLKDVATVVEGAAPQLGDASIMGKPGVILVISSQFGANTLEVTQSLEQTLKELAPVFQTEGITLYPRLFRAASFIETSVHNVGSSFLMGGVLVLGVLLLFLMDFRTTFISFAAIPLSLLAAIVLLGHLGLTLNTMTLGGLAIAIGTVVDDAIIDVENIFRRLRENRINPNPKSAPRVVLEASLEVRNATVYATFIIALVFLPILTMSGIEGKLFGPLGKAYILAILASLLVALTVTPALSLALLSKASRTRMEPILTARLKARYRYGLEKVSHRPKLIIAVVIGLCLSALALFPFLGGTFLPESRENQFIIQMSAIPGTSVPESLRLGEKVTEELLKNPHIRSVAQRVGRAELADDTWGTHYSEFDVEIYPSGGRKAPQIQSEIRGALSKFPGAYFAIKPFLTDRMEETISGVTADVAIKIYGDDLDLIDQKAMEVAQIISRIRGAVDVQIQSPPGMPLMKIQMNPQRLARFGFEPVEALDAIQTAYQGKTVAQTYEGNRVFDVVVILDPAMRKDPETVGSLLLRNSQGILVPLREVAQIEQTAGRYAILHDGTNRRQAVTCNVRGRDLASFISEAQKRIQEKVAFPSGVYPLFAGTAEAKTQAEREILLYSLMVGIGILLLLFIVFKNLRNLLLVSANLPFAFVGGVLVVFFTGGWLSVGSLVGLVTLFGITLRNSMMMISHYDHLVTEEGMPWGPETAWRGASERLIPILMTALVTGLGLLPIAIGQGKPGQEIEGPMAIVILGGLVTSTVLNLLVLPTLALRYGQFRKQV